MLGVMVHVDEPPLDTLVGVQEIEPPVPAVARMVYCCVVPAVNVAVTFFAADIVTVQVEFDPDAAQSPPHVTVEPEVGAAVRVTGVPESYDAVPVLPFHVRLSVEVVTEPVPDPDFVTVRV